MRREAIAGLTCHKHSKEGQGGRYGAHMIPRISARRMELGWDPSGKEERGQGYL